ncbi:Hypothetical_protein [Hexamita inflata]|uniref:Hypothetical_protein n=1 Tax=Hexamita inflata TaxID=28002 RepID=A0AA86QGU3_9EUKA|nr:Hypothetical protein HINF_LOCUS46686 [Hexamita inflata]
MSTSDSWSHTSSHSPSVDSEWLDSNAAKSKLLMHLCGMQSTSDFLSQQGKSGGAGSCISFAIRLLVSGELSYLKWNGIIQNSINFVYAKQALNQLNEQLNNCTNYIFNLDKFERKFMQQCNEIANTNTNVQRRRIILSINIMQLCNSFRQQYKLCITESLFLLYCYQQ